MGWSDPKLKAAAKAEKALEEFVRAQAGDEAMAGLVGPRGPARSNEYAQAPTRAPAGSRVYGPDPYPGFVPPAPREPGLSGVSKPPADDLSMGYGPDTAPAIAKDLAMPEPIQAPSSDVMHGPELDPKQNFQVDANGLTQLLAPRPAPAPTTPEEMFALRSKELLQQEMARATAAPQGKGSGGTSSAENDTTLKGGATFTQRSPVKPGDYQSVLAQARQTPEYLAQKGGIDDLEEMYARGSQPDSRINLAPLLAYADQVSGGNLLASYKQPMTEAERMDKIMKYAEKIQGDRNALSQRASDAAKLQLGGNTFTDTLAQIVAARSGQKYSDPTARGGSGDPNKDYKFLMREFSKDAMVKEAYEKSKGAQDFFSSLAVKNWVGDSSLKFKAARLAGAQPLSNFDALQFASTPEFVGKLESVWSKLTTGELPDADRKSFHALAKISQRNAAVTYIQSVQDFAAKAGFLGLDPAKMKGLLGNSYMSKVYDELTKLPPDIREIALKQVSLTSPEEQAKLRAYYSGKGPDAATRAIIAKARANTALTPEEQVKFDAYISGRAKK